MADHRKDNSSAPLVVVYPFLELSRAYQIADGLFSIGNKKRELLDRKVFTERLRVMMRLDLSFGVQFRDRFREFVERALQSFEYRRIHTDPQLAPHRLEFKLPRNILKWRVSIFASSPTAKLAPCVLIVKFRYNRKTAEDTYYPFSTIKPNFSRRIRAANCDTSQRSATR